MNKFDNVFGLMRERDVVNLNFEDFYITSLEICVDMAITDIMNDALESGLDGDSESFTITDRPWLRSRGKILRRFVESYKSFSEAIDLKTKMDDTMNICGASRDTIGVCECSVAKSTRLYKLDNKLMCSNCVEREMEWT